MEPRWRLLERLETRRFDLLVVGAGIIGARIAYEAASLGLSVAIVDAGDFGGATSSASSKLLHGGFRYLARFQLGLVRQAQRERRVLAQRVAPHLARACPIVVAVQTPQTSRRLRLRAGVSLYDALAGFQSPRPRLIGTAEIASLLPTVDPARIGAAALVHEVQTNDARLVLATIEGAVRAGATALNYARVSAFEGSAALIEDVLGGGTAVARFRSVVNATGPWLDAVRRLEDPSAKPLVRLSKGVQGLFAPAADWRAGVAIFDEHRSVFAVPWQGLLLVGATDEPFDRDPSELAPTVESVRQLQVALDPLLPELGRSRPLSMSAGLRVLPQGRGKTSDAPRDHVVERSASGMVSVGGGKLTTHRVVACAALARLPHAVRPRRLMATDAALPGGERPACVSGVDPETAMQLVSMYGSRAEDVLAYARDDPGLLEPIRENGPDIWAQARFAVEREWAATAEDVLMRRTSAGLRGSCAGDLEARLLARLPELEPAAASR
jgi:glycerol-3-phosphate dehydrogenase